MEGMGTHAMGNVGGNPGQMGRQFGNVRNVLRRLSCRYLGLSCFSPAHLCISVTLLLSAPKEEEIVLNSTCLISRGLGGAAVPEISPSLVVADEEAGFPEEPGGE